MFLEHHFLLIGIAQVDKIHHCRTPLFKQKHMTRGNCSMKPIHVQIKAFTFETFIKNILIKLNPF